MSERVVFVHSTGATSDMWRRIPLEAIGGRDAAYPANVGYPPNRALARGERKDERDDAAGVVRAAEGAERVHLVAHSYGGLVALRALEGLGARVASLVVYEPVLFAASYFDDPRFADDDDRGGTEPWLRVFVDFWNRPGAWDKLPEGARAELRNLGWVMYQEARACAHMTTPFEAWPIAAPTTILVGERSPAVSARTARALADAQPRATLRILPRLGHMAPLTSPAPVAAAIAEHFAGLR